MCQRGARSGSRWWVRSRHLSAAFAGGSHAELSQRGRRQSANGQLHQHNQQHRDQNGVRPDDWYDVACVSPELAHAVLERAPLASVIRMRSSQEIAAVVCFAWAASSFARARRRSLLCGSQQRLVLRQRSLLRRAQQRFAPRHRRSPKSQPRRCLELFRAFTFPDYQGDLSLYRRARASLLPQL